MRVLIVEDEVDLALAIARGLRQKGHGVDVVGSVLDGDMALSTSIYDLVVLDWNLPDGAGIDLCTRVARGEVQTLDGSRPRILMLTARDGVDDRVAGLDAGADDYLVKPFAFSELEARVRSLLRRDSDAAPELRAGGITVDPVGFIASRDGRTLALTTKEFALLEYLVAHAGEVLSQETLLEHVWDQMANPFTNTVRVTISNLRKKLGEPQPIETVPGRGYVLR